MYSSHIPPQFSVFVFFELWIFLSKPPSFLRLSFIFKIRIKQCNQIYFLSNRQCSLHLLEDNPLFLCNHSFSSFVNKDGSTSKLITTTSFISSCSSNYAVCWICSFLSAFCSTEFEVALSLHSFSCPSLQGCSFFSFRISFKEVFLSIRRRYPRKIIYWHIPSNSAIYDKK